MNQSTRPCIKMHIMILYFQKTKIIGLYQLTKASKELVPYVVLKKHIDSLFNMKEKLRVYYIYTNRYIPTGMM